MTLVSRMTSGRYLYALVNGGTRVLRFGQPVFFVELSYLRGRWVPPPTTVGSALRRKRQRAVRKSWPWPFPPPRRIPEHLRKPLYAAARTMAQPHAEWWEDTGDLFCWESPTVARAGFREQVPAPPDWRDRWNAQRMYP